MTPAQSPFLEHGCGRVPSPASPLCPTSNHKAAAAAAAFPRLHHTKDTLEYVDQISLKKKKKNQTRLEASLTLSETAVTVAAAPDASAQAVVFRPI